MHFSWRLAFLHAPTLILPNHHQPPNVDAIEITNSSYIAVSPTINLDEVEELLNREAPGTLHTIAETKVCGSVDLLVGDVDIKCDLNGSVTRSGRITVDSVGDGLRVSIPIKFGVTARGQGEIGKNIRSTAEGALIVRAILRPKFNQDWRPEVITQTGFEYTDRPHIEIVGIPITFGSKLEPKIREFLGNFERELASSIQEQDFQAQVGQAWSEMQDPITVADQPAAWVVLTPRRAFLPAVRTEGRNLVLPFAFETNASLFVQEDAPNIQKSPLSLLETEELPTAENTFRLSLPVFVNLADGCASLNAAIEESGLDIPVDLEGTNFSIDSVSCYASGSSLALALGMTIETPGAWYDPRTWFDTSGTAYLLLTPEYDPEASTIAAADYEITPNFDNALSNIAVSILNLGSVKNELLSHLSFSFGDDIGEVKDQAEAELAGLSDENLIVSGTIDRLAIDRISVTNNNLVVVVGAEGSLSIVPIIARPVDLPANPRTEAGET